MFLFNVSHTQSIIVFQMVTTAPPPFSLQPFPVMINLVNVINYNNKLVKGKDKTVFDKKL